MYQNFKDKYNAYDMSVILQDISEINSTISYTDYGLGEEFTPTEVHVISYIAANPGITMTEIANNRCKTKGAISQMIKRLEVKKLVKRGKDAYNDKKVMLYVTERGAKLDKLHRKYDDQKFGFIVRELLDSHTDGDLKVTFDVLTTLLNVYRQQ